MKNNLIINRYRHNTVAPDEAWDELVAKFDQIVEALENGEADKAPFYVVSGGKNSNAYVKPGYGEGNYAFANSLFGKRKGLTSDPQVLREQRDFILNSLKPDFFAHIDALKERGRQCHKAS